MNEKVSVIIPTYKRSDFLLRAIDTVLNQTYDNVEVVVIDDNDPSSQYRAETISKMQKYEENKKVMYLKNERNLGGALARNEGIFKATGDFITFLDDDDIYLPDKIKVQLEYMLKSDKDMSFSDVRINDTSDNLIDYREHPYIKDFSNEELLKQHIMHHLTPTATYMFKKKAILKIGGFDDARMGQEFMLMLKAIEKGLKIGYLPVANIIQYAHDGERISIGQNKIDKKIEEYSFKKKYFNKLSFRQRQYVKFRHHAVMAVVGKRSGKPMLMIKHLILAGVLSPLDCILEVVNHKRKISKHKMESV